MGNSFFSFLLHALLSIWRQFILEFRGRGVHLTEGFEERRQIQSTKAACACLSGNCNTFIAARHFDKNRSFLWNSEDSISYPKEALKVDTREKCGYFMYVSHCSFHSCVTGPSMEQGNLWPFPFHYFLRISLWRFTHHLWKSAHNQGSFKLSAGWAYTAKKDAGVGVRNKVPLFSYYRVCMSVKPI